MSAAEEHERDMERVVKACQDLGEHFDAVEIFVTKHTNPTESDVQKTFTAHRGTGNWCSRYGQVREWVIYEEERIRCAGRAAESDEKGI